MWYFKLNCVIEKNVLPATAMFVNILHDDIEWQDRYSMASMHYGISHEGDSNGNGGSKLISNQIWNWVKT